MKRRINVYRDKISLNDFIININEMSLKKDVKPSLI